MSLMKKLFPGNGKPQVWILIDPDDMPLDDLLRVVEYVEKDGASTLLIGGSFLSNDNFDHSVREIKNNTRLPLVIFPGNARQLSPAADGILFTSLLSGRNPQYLICEQVMAAPLVMGMGLEVIPTAYLMVESGRTTSAQFVSNTQPIPRDKHKLALAHAQAGMLMGMKAIYLEAGSGADRPVPPQMIKTLKQGVKIPVIAGGGIRSIEDATAAVNAGADAIVIGTAIEKYGRDFMVELMEGLQVTKA